MAKQKSNCMRLQFTGVLEDGTVTTNRERIVERSREFYEKLYSSTRSRSELDTLPPPDNDTEPARRLEGFPDVEAWEVKLAVKQSKKGKAPGPDNVTIDLIETAGELVYERLATLFSECLHQSKIPEKWDEAMIILLHKKGDQKRHIKLPSNQSSQQHLQAVHKDHHETAYTNSR